MPTNANRYLLSAFSIERDRWYTDTFTVLGLARDYARDKATRPERYSHVRLTDLVTGATLPLEEPHEIITRVLPPLRRVEAA